MTTRRSLLKAALLINGLPKLAGCSFRPHQQRIFVAKSLERTIHALTQKGAPLAAVQVVSAGSQSIARQIAATRRGDLIISADVHWVNWLQERSLILPGSRRGLLHNELVIAAHHESPLKLSSLTDLTFIQYQALYMGDPLSVPAGRYGKLLLKRENIWQKLQGKLRTTVNVRGALAPSQSRKDTLSLVYATDVKNDPLTKIIYRGFSNPEEIVYVAAILSTTTDLHRAQTLLNTLQSDLVHSFFLRDGFIVPGNSGHLS